MFIEIVLDHWKIEGPIVSSFLCFEQGVLEDSAPFGTKNVMFQIQINDIESSFDIDSLQIIENVSKLGIAIVVVLIHWAGI